ncbi:hypothetical protein NPIL_171611, partial [Nephila pilipes]
TVPLLAACFASHLQTQCGPAAGRLYVHIAREFTPLLEMECTSENISEVKKNILDVLDLEGDEKHLFQYVFDVLKRRK